VVEYWTTIDPGDYGDDEVIEVRAIAYPVDGVPRVLESLYLNVNPTTNKIYYIDAVNGSDETGDATEGNPWQTITAISRVFEFTSGDGIDNAIIYMQAGSYTITTDFVRTYNPVQSWVTFMAAPGVATSDVIITATSLAGIKLKYVHWKNIKFAPPTPTEAFFNPVDASGDYHVWIDGCTCLGPGRQTGYQFFGTGGGYGSVWVTDCDYSGTQDGLYFCNLVRNTYVHDIQADCFHAAKCIINCRIRGVANYEWGTGTNLTVDGSDATLVTPDGFSVTSDDIGRAVFVSTSGGWTDSSYDIIGASGGKWTLSPATTGFAALGATGGHWSLRSGNHPDVYQFLVADNTNIIFYGIDADPYGEGQGIPTAGRNAQSSPIDGLAVVNCNVTSTSNSVCYFYNTLINVYFLNCDYSGNSLLGPDGDDYGATDCVSENTLFHDGPNFNISLGDPGDSAPGWTVRTWQHERDRTAMAEVVPADQAPGSRPFS
jgi:hypothetical protein